MSEHWKSWARAAGVRALKTVAQTAVATIGTAAAMGQVNWIGVASTAALVRGAEFADQRRGAAGGKGVGDGAAEAARRE